MTVIRDFLAAIDKISTVNAKLEEVLDLAALLELSGEGGLAVQLYRIWVAFNPESPLLPAANFNLSVLLAEQGNLTGARDTLERVIAANPDFFPAQINLGGIYEKLGHPDLATRQWLDLANRLGEITGPLIGYKTTALKQLSRVLEDHHRFDVAETALRQSIEIDAHQTDVIEHFLSLRLQQCEWPTVSPWEGVDCKTLMGGVTPLLAATYTDDPMFHLASAHAYNKTYDPPSSYRLPRHHPEARRPGRLRIGYVSSDLRAHAVGFLLSEVFELHDRGSMEIFAYYCGPAIDDAHSARIKAAVEHWVDISLLDDATAAQRIVADDIDILVDVNGYTRFARTGIFAMRPAPIQVNWLGFPGSMGSPYHHYILADDWIIPPDSELYYSEKVLRLPCYQPSDRKRVVAPAPSRADADLPEAAVVYCCFNGWQKISRFCFERWMEILRRVPDSVLWLLEGADPSNRRPAVLAEHYGIAPERLVFAPKLPNDRHLARYPLADLFLDTSPYGAHTTASDALWMGVPVLTVSGHGFASRVCSSLVRAAGLEDLICHTGSEYVERAVTLGQDRDAMLQLRQRLVETRESCRLFDMEGHVARLESLYRQMAADYQRGDLPSPDLRNLDIYLAVAMDIDHESVEVQGIDDYAGWYQANMARYHRLRPIPEDNRLWPPGMAQSATAEGF